MTKYNYPAPAYDRYLFQQKRISTWIVDTEQHRDEFGNALTAVPSGASLTARASSHSAQSPSCQKSTIAPSSPTSSTSPISVPAHDVLKVPGGIAKKTEVAGQVAPQSSRRACSHSPSRCHPRRSSSARHQTSNDREPRKSPTFILIPPAAPPAYVYGPSGWAPPAGVVIISSKRNGISALVSSSLRMFPTPVLAADIEDANQYAAPQEPKSPLVRVPQYYRHPSCALPQAYVPYIYPHGPGDGITYAAPHHVSAQATFDYPLTGYPSLRPPVVPVSRSSNAQVRVQGSYIYSQPHSQVIYQPLTQSGQDITGGKYESKSVRRVKDGSRNGRRQQINERRSKSATRI